jgi:hypothetical protein
MKRSVFSIFAALLVPASFFSQQTFVPGYIVQPAGDTLKGEVKVNEKKPLEPYAKVTFRDASGVQKILKPAKLPAYGMGEKHFIALQEGEEFNFYKVVARGHITLLEWKYEGLRMNKPVVETEYFLRIPGQKSLEPVKEKSFRKQLLALTTDHPEPANDYPDEKQFDPDAAAAAINAYNAWKTGANTQ